MSFATKSKDLPSLPIVIENDNLEDISIENNRPVRKESIKLHNPYFHSNTSQYSKENLSTLSSKASLTGPTSPSIPSTQVQKMSFKNGENLSKAKSNPSSSQYVIRLDKTPLNLTPSQRLKLRKLQLNDSIAKFNLPSKENSKYFMDDESDDEEIDENDCVYNVPFSQPITSLTRREKYVSDNDRKSSGTDSTRSSSIWSHDSVADTSSIISCNCDDTLTGSKSSIHHDFSRLGRSLNALSMSELNLSKDAHDLTFLFNKNETVQINEESRERRKMLSNFKRIPRTVPSTPLDESFANLSMTNDNRSCEFPILDRPSASRSQSQPTLPISTKERKHQSAPSKYYTFTRPTWLPPKSTYDRIKHQKESEDIIHRALRKEAAEKKDKLVQLNKIKKLREKDIKSWEKYIESDNKLIEKKEKKISEMYWRGLLEDARSRVWEKQIGNDLKLNDIQSRSYFEKFDQIFMKKIRKFDDLLKIHAECAVALEEEKNHSSGSKDIDETKMAEITSNNEINNFLRLNPNMLSVKALFDRINQDLLDTYPDIGFFQNADATQTMMKLIVSFVIYLNETRGNFEINDNTLSMINTDYYFTGLNTLVALLFYHNRSSHRTFIALANFYNRGVLNSIINNIIQDNGTGNETACKLLNTEFIAEFDSLFKKNLIRLYTHFEVIGLKSHEYVPDILAGLFSNLFSFELSCQILDIYVFEDTTFLMKCLLGLLKQISFKLFGTKQEALDLLGENCRRNLNDTQGPSKGKYKYLNVGLDYDFIKTVKEMQV